MRNYLVFLGLIVSLTLKGQNTSKDYTIFNPTQMKKEFFITSNSGTLNTPIGIKIGYISNPGLYLGFRYGKGKVYNSDSNLETVSSNLYSIVGGVTKPLIIKNDFKLIAQLGLGYGQWWDYRWERWTKSGYEIEAGLMVQKRRFLLNLTGNLLNGNKTYATGDFCIGVGYVFKNRTVKSK